MTDEPQYNLEVVRNADLPQVQAFDGPIRVQILENASQHEAVEALRWLAEHLSDYRNWQNMMGK